MSKVVHAKLGKDSLDAAIATPSGPLRDGSGREFYVTEWAPHVNYDGRVVVVVIKAVVYVPEEDIADEAIGSTIDPLADANAQAESECMQERELLEGEIKLLVAENTRLKIILDRVCQQFRKHAENYGGEAYAQNCLDNALNNE